MSAPRAGNAPAAARGLSLVELLVAVGIGGLLMAGAVTLFVNNRATYEITNDMARLQENARFAFLTMVRDLRLSGYFGCIDDFTEIENNTGATDGSLWDVTHAIEGIDNGDASWSPSGHVGVAVSDSEVSTFDADSDAITIRYIQHDRDDADTTTETLDLEVTNTALKGTSRTLAVENLTIAFQVGEYGAVTDCGSGDVFEVLATGTDQITANELSRAYDPINRALVGRLAGSRYFVRPNAAGVPALHQTSLVGNAESTVELIDGVQSLQILYGQDTTLGGGTIDGVPDRFVPASSLVTRDDWLSVVSVRLSLLMSTIDEFGNDVDDSVYEVGNERICNSTIAAGEGCTIAFAPDRRRRRVFQTTVALRNFQ